MIQFASKLDAKLMCKSKTLRQAAGEASGTHFSAPNNSEIRPQIQKKSKSKAIRTSASKKEALLTDLDPWPGLVWH